MKVPTSFIHLGWTSTERVLHVWIPRKPTEFVAVNLRNSVAPAWCLQLIFCLDLSLDDVLEVIGHTVSYLSDKINYESVTSDSDSEVRTPLVNPDVSQISLSLFLESK